MPASLPGSTRVQNEANPTLGQFVIFSPLSGPKGSPLDQQMFDYSTGTPPGWNITTRLPIKIAGTATPSTGMLSTGIGIGANYLIDAGGTAPVDIFNAGFNDNMVPGEKVTVYTAPPPNGVVTTDIVDSTRMFIGGGRMVASTTYPGVPFISSPYTAGVAIVGAGNGASRDGGAGPAFTGFPLKMVTATGTVANAAAIETGFVNRSGVGMVSGQSAFGSDIAQLAAAS